MNNRRNSLENSVLSLGAPSVGLSISKPAASQSVGSPTTLSPIKLFGGESLDPGQSAGHLLALYFFSTSCFASNIRAVRSCLSITRARPYRLRIEPEASAT